MWMIFGGIQFGSFHLSKITLTKWAKIPENSMTSFLSGGIAGCLATVTVYPLDLLRTRFAAQSIPPIHTTIKSAVEIIYKTQGWTGFYHGVCPSLWQLVPYMAMQFFVYDSLKERISLFTQSYSSSYSGIYSSTIAGGIAGLVAKLSVLPLDVVKKRLQVHGLNLYRDGRRLPARCPGLIHTVKSIHSSEGVSAFFKGSIPSVLKATLQSALVFTLYEETRKILKKHL